MKRILIAIAAVTLGLTLNISDAEAKRLGGGKSAGMTRDASAMKAPATPPKQATPTQNAAPASASAPAAAAAPKSGMSRWLGPLAGLAAGIGLAALLSHFGMGEGVANFLMIALLVMAVVFVVRMLMRKRQPETGMQYAGAGAPTALAPSQFEANKLGAGEAAPSVTPVTPVAATGGASVAPAGFDVEGFVRQAKLNFVRLQAANDRGDMDDIREFTSPELFAEIQMQYQERGKAAQQTDVLQLEADLLDVTEESGRYVTSVRFSGQLREDANAAADFAEIWHLTKPTDGSRGWQIAGIQQA